MPNKSLMIARICIAVILTMPISSYSADTTEPESSKGTITIAIGNDNGVVVATDSRATVTYPNGKVEFEDDHQKLFQITDSIVVTIAGYGFSNTPNFTISAAGIILNYKTQVSKQKRMPSYSEVVKALPNVLRYGLTAVSNIQISADRPKMSFKCSLSDKMGIL